MWEREVRGEENPPKQILLESTVIKQCSVC